MKWTEERIASEIQSLMNKLQMNRMPTYTEMKQRNRHKEVIEMGMAVPKPAYKNHIPKRSKRNNFSKKVREQIIERDEGLCRNCGSPGSQIHHVMYRSHSGRGVFTNGLLVCNGCHEKIHRNKELKESWQRTFKMIYGPRYWKDEWDD